VLIDTVSFLRIGVCSLDIVFTWRPVKGRPTLSIDRQSAV